LIRHTPRTALIPPATECVAVNSYLTTIIVSEHELNRVVFRNRDVAGHVNHEQIACAIFVRFTVITAIDVVLDL